jgi:peptidoglycan/xylan/chitin deacetylase (PgdA/CDA1 family)
VGSLRIVLYHHLSDARSELTDGLGVTTPPRLFERHLARFERDYEVVDLETVLSGRLPRRALLITFDDGYRSVLDVAAPIMARRGLPGVFFVSGAFTESGSLPLDNLICALSHRVAPAALENAVTGRAATGLDPRRLTGLLAALPYERRVALSGELAERFEVDRGRLRADSGLFLEGEELRGLRPLGIEVGNHTRSHLHCRAITGARAAAEELVEHRRRLEELADAPVRSFSYPYGSRHDATPFVERVLRASGHEARFLVESRHNTPATRESWHRVSLQQTPASKLFVQLEVMPRLRTLRDRLQPPAPVGGLR